MESVKIKVEITVPFFGYGNKLKNKKAAAYIKKYVECLVKDIRFIPFYVEKDETGAWIEDCSRKVKAKIIK